MEAARAASASCQLPESDDEEDYSDDSDRFACDLRDRGDCLKVGLVVVAGCARTTLNPLRKAEHAVRLEGVPRHWERATVLTLLEGFGRVRYVDVDNVAGGGVAYAEFFADAAACYCHRVYEACPEKLHGVRVVLQRDPGLSDAAFWGAWERLVQANFEDSADFVRDAISAFLTRHGIDHPSAKKWLLRALPPFLCESVSEVFPDFKDSVSAALQDIPAPDSDPEYPGMWGLGTDSWTVLAGMFAKEAAVPWYNAFVGIVSLGGDDPLLAPSRGIEAGTGSTAGVFTTENQVLTPSLPGVAPPEGGVGEYVVVPRGAPLPVASSWMTFTTSYDGQTAVHLVVRGEGTGRDLYARRVDIPPRPMGEVELRVRLAVGGSAGGTCTVTLEVESACDVGVNFSEGFKACPPSPVADASPTRDPLDPQRHEVELLRAFVARARRGLGAACGASGGPRTAAERAALGACDAAAFHAAASHAASYFEADEGLTLLQARALTDALARHTGAYLRATST